MAKFSEILNSIKDSLDGFITKDTPTDQITQIGKVKEQLTELSDAHKQTLDDYGELKDRYIESIKNYGTGKEPTSEIDSKQGKSFEEIGQTILARDNNKKG